MASKKKDPLGVQPAPVTGSRLPVPRTREIRQRSSAARQLLEDGWIEHAPQRAIIDELLDYRDETVGRLGRPLSGRRLSQFSQAGKSKTMARLKAELSEEREAAGLPPNPYQVVIVELDRRLNLKGFYQEVLRKLDDEFWDADVSAKVLENRIADFVRRLGVELLIADEVQHLKRKANDANEVSDRFKVFLDRGIVPLVLVGDEDSVEFFRANGKLAARLGRPLELAPLAPRTSARDAKLFKAFCASLDDALKENGIFTYPSKFTAIDTLYALLDVSGGHVGRVARLVGVAASDAVRRGADCVEPYDLSRATREFAIGAGWVINDPFSKVGA
ncbi:MAG TPA: ATP-binding protein [Allosphingosinicella sp.]|jgi:hypothetical protein|nr:ATP-binding protein [Allosphingosinicella sp.]